MIQITNEDNMELMARYEDNYFDLAIVDPPYGIGMGASLNVNSKTKFIDKKWDDKIPNIDYFNELKRVSKNQIIWGGNYFGNLWADGCRSYICWNKLNHHDNRADVEMAWTSFNRLAKYVEYMWDGNRYGTKNNIKGVGKPTIRIHPTEKPIYLYRWILDNYAKQGDKILDTHLGSGSIAIACEEEGFDLIACEIDKDYFNDATKRLNETRMQTKLF